jgi:ADP-ribose pyrophosphatase YjhB (NUDIX family)
VAGDDEPRWLDWARRLQALAQSGLAFTQDDYDAERYREVRAIAAEMIAAGAGAEPTPLLARLERELGYATPKVDVRAFVPRGGAVLMVRERVEQRWTLPGGWVDVGETPSEAARRETLEEAGWHVRPTRLLALWDRRRHPHPPMFHHVYKLFVGCEAESYEGRIGGETDDAGFFPLAALPPLSTSRVTAAQITRLAELHAHPDRPAAFD